MAPPIYFVMLLLVLRHLKEVFLRENSQMGNNEKNNTAVVL